MPADGDGGAPRYSRCGTNPTQEAVATKIASLEGMDAGLVLGSGMAAVAMTLLSLTRSGDHIVASGALYGATRRFLSHELPRRGVEVTFVEVDQPRQWRSCLRPSTRLLYLELPANPLLRVPDPRPVASLAREMGILLVADTTFASPVNFRGREHGVDVVVQSGSKYLGGHSDLVAGVVCGPEEVVEEVRGMLELYGPALDPHGAWLLDRGVRTLVPRVQWQNEGALSLARWLRERPEVERVYYPGLPDHPDHETATRLLDGYGGVVSIQLQDSKAAEAFCSALRLASVAPSLGGVETLVSQPRHASHRGLSSDGPTDHGISTGIVRISVGLEELEDVKRDFQRGLAAVRQLG